MKLLAVISVALGGALGALARFGADVALGNLPLATAVVNIVGALALGLALGHTLSSMPVWLKDGITIGFLGSFTTMSGVGLIATQWLTLSYAIYVVLTFSIGIFMAWVGMRLGARWRGNAPL